MLDEVIASSFTSAMSFLNPKVVYWTHSPTPYFVARFNAIVERGGLEFEAWFNERRESIRSWDVDESQWRFPARYIPQRKLFGWSSRVPVPELLARRPDLLVQECDRAHLAAGFMAGSALASRTAFRALPSFDAWSERTWWREAGKHFVFHAVDAAKVPGPDGVAQAERYGLPSGRIATVTQSVDVEGLRHASAIEDRERSRRRAALGLDGCVFIYAGRLWVGKGTDDLFRAYEGLLETGAHVSLLLLGDGPDEPRYRQLAERLPRVVFAGFVQADAIAAYYGLADAMVFPTLGDPHGLVIEEAMACGLPVISSSAAGDVAQRLPDGRAGRIVAPRDAGALREAMRELATNEALRAEMGRAAARLVADRTHRRYAEEFEAFARGALERKARRGPAAAAARAAGRLMALSARATAPAPVIHAAPRSTAGR
jgi:glycosyltransferase involved in cell wall biosynthesis